MAIGVCDLRVARLDATGFLLKSRPKGELLAALQEFLRQASEAQTDG